MLGTPSRLRCALLLAAILSCTLTPSNAINYNHVCALVPDNSYIASNDACNTYYSCFNGVATQQVCAAGMSFSVQQQQCVPSGQANCFLNAENPCDGRPIGSWAPVPGSCQSFYYCSANGPLMSACPNNQNFDAVNQMCDYIPCSSQDNTSGESSGESSVVTINVCNFIQGGIYFGNPSACAGWSICQSGVLSAGVCNTGYYFNTNIMECDYPNDVSCIQVTNDPQLVSSMTPGGGSCSTQGQLTPVSGVCNAYYLCSNNALVLNYCAAGQYFDIPSQTCVPRMNARNDCDRCQGTTATFVNAYSQSNCTGYLYCQNGVEQSSGTCANGAYFDETLGGCAIEAEPDFGCCNPDYYGSSNSSTTTSPSNSTTVSGSSDSTTVSGSSDSTTVSGSSDSTTVSGSSDSTTVSGSSDSTTVSGSSDSTTVSGSSDSTTVSGSSDSTTVSGSSDSTTVASTTTAPTTV